MIVNANGIAAINGGTCEAGVAVAVLTHAVYDLNDTSAIAIWVPDLHRHLVSVRRRQKLLFML
jgi:hypothetical protein